MELFVVYDSMGSGRVVGVFDTRQNAEKVMAVNPHYYHVFVCELNQINPEAWHWVKSETQLAQLKDLSEHLAAQSRA